MDVPAILREEVIRPFPAGAVAGPGGVPPIDATAVTIDGKPFTIQEQKADNWCWAAVAVSVSRFYGDGQWTQCTLAEDVLSLAGCCGTPSACDEEASLADALTRTENLEYGPDLPLEFHELVDELDEGRAVCFRVEFAGGKGHFVVVSECTSSGNVTVHDPLGAVTATLSYQDLKDGYQGGRCTHSYLTKAP